jgi:hypothetical protein
MPLSSLSSFHPGGWRESKRMVGEVEDGKRGKGKQRYKGSMRKTTLIPLFLCPPPSHPFTSSSP